MGLDSKKAQAYRQRWSGLTSQTRQTDYDKAKLFYEIRSEFDKGSAGDEDFRAFIKTSLNIDTVMQQIKCLSMSKGYARFDRDLWMRGGWDSVRFLLGFRKQSSAKILERAMGKSRAALRVAAAELKLKSRNRVTGVGRPTTMETTDKLRALRSWVRYLYKTYDLPDMPKDVEQALGSVTPAERIEAADRLIA